MFQIRPVYHIYGLMTGLVILTAGCHHTHHYQLITPDKVLQDIRWTEAEQRENIAARTLARTEYSSVHLVRLKGREQPHYHDRHDLYVTQLSGQSRIHFEHHHIDVSAGDVVFIPSGTYHWAENTGPQASIISSHFSPAFDGKDKRKH